jgi:hypothetical protein
MPVARAARSIPLHSVGPTPPAPGSAPLRTAAVEVQSVVVVVVEEEEVVVVVEEVVVVVEEEEEEEEEALTD